MKKPKIYIVESYDEATDQVTVVFETRKLTEALDFMIQNDGKFPSLSQTEKV